MKKLIVLLCAVVLVCGLTGAASGAPVYLANVTPTSGWSDVYQGAGTNYCWLASASNMLAYAGWTGGASLTAAGDIFSYSTGHWTNVNGNPYYAVEWWFDGTNSNQGQVGWPLVTGGGDFYTTTLFNSSLGWAANDSGLSHANVDSFLEFDVSNNRVFTMLLGDASGGIHWLTGWGYETNGTDITGVYVTDSFNDGTPTLTFSPLDCSSGVCHLGVYSSFYVISMESLAFNSGNILPNYVPPDTVPDPASTLLLLGISMAGLVAAKRRWR